MLLQFPLLRNNALKNATCRQNEPFNEEHQDLSAEQFRQMMFQVLDPIPKKGSLCRQRDRKIPRESWKRWWLAGKRE